MNQTFHRILPGVTRAYKLGLQGCNRVWYGVIGKIHKRFMKVLTVMELYTAFTKIYRVS